LSKNGNIVKPDTGTQ